MDFKKLDINEKLQNKLRESGFENECEKNKQLFFSGKIDYKTWAEMDIALLKGVSRREIMQIIDKINLENGKVKSVETVDGDIFESEVVISTIDLHQTFLKYVGENMSFPL